MCMYCMVYMYVYMYIYIYIFIHTHIPVTYPDVPVHRHIVYMYSHEYVPKM